MATARRTGTNETDHDNVAGVSTFGDGTRDFTDPMTWEGHVNVQKDLVTDTQSKVLECYDDATSYDYDINIAGATADASYFRIIRPAAGEGHNGIPLTGMYFDTSDQRCAFGSESFAQIQDLIWRIAAADAGFFSSFEFGSGSTSCKFIGCIAWDSNNTGSGKFGGFQSWSGAVTPLLVLCLAQGVDDSAFYNGNTNGSVFTCYNCTGDGGASRSFRNHTSGGMTVVNCIGYISGADDFEYASGTWSNCFNCASSDGSATSLPGTGHRASQTFTFVSIAADDYRLQVTDAGARNYGKDMSSDSLFAFDDDINDGFMGGSKSGVLFDTWDIGFHEPQPAVGLIQIVMHHRKMMGVS